MPAANTHETSKDYCRRLLGDLNYFKPQLTGTNGLAAGDTTVALFKARVTTLAATMHDRDIRRGDQTNKAIDFCKNAGILIDSDVATAAGGANPTARYNSIVTILANAEGLVATSYIAIAGATP